MTLHTKCGNDGKFVVSGIGPGGQEVIVQGLKAKDEDNLKRYIDHERKMLEKYVKKGEKMTFSSYLMAKGHVAPSSRDSINHINDAFVNFGVELS